MRAQDILEKAVPSGVGSVVIIGKDQLTENARAVKKHIDGRFFWAVVKANGYGLGAVESARAFLAGGADGLAVARLEEVTQLRKSGITCPLLLLGPLPNNVPEDDALHLTVSTAEELNRVSSSGHPIHIKVDTGMGRIGFLYDDTSWVPSARQMGDRWFGLWSHYSHADTLNAQESLLQQQRMEKVIKAATADQTGPAQIHMANSGGLACLQPWETAVRIGLYLYGVTPWDTVCNYIRSPVPVFNWLTRLLTPRDVPADWGLSYRSLYRTNEARRVAVIPVGYADGLPAANPGELLVYGNNPYPIRGRVTMDASIIEIDEQATEREILAIVGSHSRVEQLAQSTGRIAYECLTAIGPRVQRHYVDTLEGLTP